MNARIRTILSCVLGCGLAAVAQQPNPATPQASSPPASTATSQELDQGVTLTVSGEGVVKVRPDVATVRLGSEAQASTAAAAQSAVNATVERILDALTQLGIAEEAIQTVGLTLEPIFTSPQPGQEDQPPTLVGFRAVNTIQVDIFDLERIGEVIDAAFQAGANRLEGISFGLVDPSPSRRQAIQLAARDAMATAQVLAETLEVRLVAVRRVRVDALSFPIPLAAAATTDQTAGASTPVEPGQLEVRATVTIVYEVQESLPVE